MRYEQVIFSPRFQISQTMGLMLGNYCVYTASFLSCMVFIKNLAERAESIFVSFHCYCFTILPKSLYSRQCLLSQGLKNLMSWFLRSSKRPRPPPVLGSLTTHWCHIGEGEDETVAATEVLFIGEAVSPDGFSQTDYIILHTGNGPPMSLF